MTNKNNQQEIKLTGIRVYPVKSLPAIHFEQNEVQPQGLKDDRLYMLVDENGLFITQRKYPQLALIKVQQTECSFSFVAENRLPITIDETNFQTETLKVKIWQDECVGLVADVKVNQWFSQYLGFPVRLVRYNHQAPRAIDGNYSQPDDIVSFADGFPLLVISQASLNDLNSKLETPVSMTNFRPNIIVDGCDAFAEDDWKQIRIGEVIFDAVKRCSRCVLTTVNPETGKRSENGQPLKTLSQYRKAEGGVFFGMNLIPRSAGTIQVNDMIEFI